MAGYVWTGPKTSSILIDHHATNSARKIARSGVIHIGISDHSLILAMRKINPTTKTGANIRTIKFRNIKRFDQQHFIADLLGQPLERIVLQKDTNWMWSCRKEMFLEILSKHAPIQNKRTRSFNVPSLTKEIKELILDRDKFKRKAVVANQDEDWKNYKSVRNKVNIACGRLKQIIIAIQLHPKRIILKTPGKQTIISLAEPTIILLLMN